MPLVEHYEDSDEESLDAKSQALPPVPESVLHKYHLAPAIEMLRSGSGAAAWRSFVYLEWRPSARERARLTRLVARANELLAAQLPDARFEPLHYSCLGAPAPLHVSLSRTLQFSSDHQRAAFFQDLRERASDIPSFTLQADRRLQLYASESNHSAYLAFPVAGSSLTQLFDAVQAALPIDTHHASLLASSAHMSIARAVNIPSATVWDHITRDLAQELEWLPSFQATEFRVDRNRESLSVPLR